MLDVQGGVVVALLARWTSQQLRMSNRTRVLHLTCGTSVADIVNVIGCCVRWLFINVLRDWLVCVYFRIASLLHLICAPDMSDDLLAMPFFIGIRFTISPYSFISVTLCSASLHTLMYLYTIHSHIPGICQHTNCDVRCVSPKVVKLVTQFLCIVQLNWLLRYCLYSCSWIKLKVLGCGFCVRHCSPQYWTWFTMVYVSRYSGKPICHYCICICTKCKVQSYYDCVDVHRYRPTYVRN